MSWVLQKILLGRLRKFFHIQDDKNVQLSLLSKRQVKCQNLILKNEVINKPSMPVLIKHCSISLLQISFDGKKTFNKPLNVRLSGVKLTVAFNLNRKPEENKEEDKKQGKKIERPVIQQFYKAVGSQQQYQERTFLQEQIYQLKQLFAEYALGELCLQAKQIDVSIEYMSDDKPKYFGVQLDEMVLKQEMIIKQGKAADQNKSSSLHCQLNNIKAYFGVKVEQNPLFKQADPRQVFRNLQNMRKKYITRDSQINVLYNFNQNSLNVISKQIKFNIQDILVHQVINLSQFASSKFKDQPKIRPGEGDDKLIYLSKDHQSLIKTGTIIWWQFIGDKLIQKFKRKANSNILNNNKFRNYLYCLLYRYTYGSDVNLQKIVDSYEYFKSDMQILKYNKLIISKVNKIQQTSSDKQIDDQIKVFMIFLLNMQKNDPQLSKLRLKKITFKDIRNSNVITNYQNCKKFIRIRQLKQINCLSININVSRFLIFLKRPKVFNAMKSQIISLSPYAYARNKKSILSFYCDQTIMQQMNLSKQQINQQTKNNKSGPNSNNNSQIKPQQVVYLQIQVDELKVQINSQNNTYLTIPKLLVSDLQTKLQIMKVFNLNFSQENMHPQVYGWRIQAEKRMQITAELLFVYLQNRFAQKILTVISYIKQLQKQTEVEQKNFISSFISKKVPNHPIFNTYQSTSKQFSIKRIIVATPVFSKEKTFEVNLKGIKYADPINGKPSFSVNQILILRSNSVNLNNKISPIHHGKKITDQTVIMANTKQLSGQIVKDNAVDVTALVIPFILIQLSCQDVFYMNNILKIWQQIMSNPYYFPPKIVRKNQHIPQINPNSVKFARSMVPYSKHQKHFDLKLQGLQFCLLSDYLNEQNNLIIDLLLDTFTYKTQSSYTQDKIQINIKDLFIRNFLSFKQINKQSLIISIRDELKYGDDPILTDKQKKQFAPQTNNAKMLKNQQLLLFCDDGGKDVRPFFKFTVQSFVDLNLAKSTVQTKINIIPLYVFYSIQFTQMIRVILSIINDITYETLENYQSFTKKDSFGTPFSFYQPNTTTTADTIEIKDDLTVQIMAATQFQQITKLQILIQKLNFLAVKNSSVVYVISLSQISARHKSQPYVQRFFFSIERFIIIDTSEQTGPQPIITDMKRDPILGKFPIQGSFTTYQSDIMKFKQKKSAYFVLILQGPQINFLKKKVLQLVNFIMMLLKQVGVLAEPDQQQANKPKKKSNQAPFCYSITINDPKIRLFRSSLSQQGFKSIGRTIQINNFKRTYTSQQQANKQAQNIQSTIFRGLNHNQQNSQVSQTFYEMKYQKGNEQIQFQSFQRDVERNSDVAVQKIYIDIKQFSIFGVKHWEKQFNTLFQDNQITAMLSIPEVYIQFFAPEMVVNVPSLEGDMYDQDFRVLMRFSQQNLSESPLLFIDNPRLQTAIKISFLTKFNVNQIVLATNVLQQNLNKASEKIKRKIFLKIYNLSGKNQLWTNNQINTELFIQNLDLSNDGQIKILERLHQQILKDLPQMPKSSQNTNLASYPQFRDMEKQTRKNLNQILQNEGEKIEIFGEQNKSDFINQNQLDTSKQKTNYQKISKWVKGMFKKCCKSCKCCRNKQNENENEDFIKNIINLHQKGQEKQELQMAPIVIMKNSYKNRTAPMIYKIQQVLDFQHQINWADVQVKKKQPAMIYLNFIIRPNGQKQMYMQAKKIQVLLQNTKGVLGLSQFFARPFAVSDIPEHVRKYKFNNAKPFKMLIQVDDTLAQIQSVNEKGETEKVCVLCDLVYDNQARGDTTIGPGLSKMRVEAVCKILFMSQRFKYPIDLSDTFKAMFLAQNRVPYGQENRNQSIQKIFMKPLQKMDQNISFFIPAFALKALNRIVLSNISKAQTQDQMRANALKAQQIRQQLNNDLQKQKKTNTIKKTLTNINEKSIKPQFPKEEPPPISKKISDSLSKNVQIDKGKQMIKEHKKMQMNVPPPPVSNKQSHSIRFMYVSQITLQIQSKLESSFIKSKIKDVKYSQLFINNKVNKINIRNILANLDVNYWNLKLGVYQPCVEPWPFKVEQIVHQRDTLSSASVKVSSNLDTWKKSQGDYINDLNVNITLPLYQTLKQLMIVYDQENYDDNEDCYDLTSTQNSDYDGLFGRTRKSPLIMSKKFKNFPKKLVKYFTRVFKFQNQTLKNYLTNANKVFFNPPLLVLYLYHSYFDHFRRKKCITYRTPYRILNATNVNLFLWFYNPKDKSKWKSIVKMCQYYAIPSIIYQSDYLVHISDSEQQPLPGSPYVSVKYLIQMKAKKSKFKKLDLQSVTWKNIFKYSSVQTQKYIDSRDMPIKIGNKCFVAISVFSKHQPKQQQTAQFGHIEDLKFYDAYCIIQSPIIIDNYSYLDFEIKVDRKEIVKIPKNERIQINQPLRSDVSTTTLQFLNDNLHQERRILKQKFGNIAKVMQIEKLQSVKLFVSRQTTNSCLIKIYTEWNIKNYTNQCFSLKNSQKLFLVDKMSFSCLSAISNKGIDFCILNQEKFTKKIKPDNIADVITLAKKKQLKKQQQDKIIQAHRVYRKQKCCQCFKRVTQIYEFIDFALNSSQDPIQPLSSQKIDIRYRYQILNKTSSQIRLCQYSNQFIIAKLPPFKANEKPELKYIFFYDFIPKVYFLQIQVFEDSKMKTIRSCDFNLDQFPGSTFIIKIKKDSNNIQSLQYKNRFYYYHIQIKKIQQQTLIEVRDADFQDFPIYINNITEYPIKLTEGDDQFMIPSQGNIPFAWSHLISNKYQLGASIEGVEDKQKYLFNNKSAFQPIKIIDKNKKRKKKIQNLYLKQYCYVLYEYLGISTICLVILDLFDNKLRIHNKEQNINTELKMSEVQKLQPLASKIQIHFGSNDVIELVPPAKVIKTWIQKLQECINEDVVDKIFFTIQSYNNSRIFFFRTVGDQQYQSSKQQYVISHLNVSLISAQPEQIILLYCGDISYIQHDKKNKLNYNSLEISQSEKIITLKKIKISNQTKDAINPVVLSRIKKSNYPFLELRLIQQKLHLQAEQKGKYTASEQLEVKQNEEKITHYRQVTFFMDEAEVMVEAALFLKIFNVKKSFDDITNQYAVGAKMSEKDMQLVASSQQIPMGQNNYNSQLFKKSIVLVKLPDQQTQLKKNPLVYINYLQIKPLKITASVYLQHNQGEDIQINLISILRYIPFGIQNAIIQIESYQFFHVFYDMKQLNKQLMKFYKKQAWNQIYKNAGSYDMLLPIQLIGGVGNGVKQIFYNPIYELVRKKQIKAVGKSFAEGLLSFIVFLVHFLLKSVNLVFKIFTLFTFDQKFRTKRQSFRKQIFKSPVQGAVLGAKNFWNVFKSFFVNFANIRKKYEGYSVFGYFLGFIICIIKIVPWVVKLVVSFYDWFYVIFLGFVNWGYYEQSAMKSRSRPRRIFYHKQVVPYNYLLSLGNQIIRQNQLQQIENEQIHFVKAIQGKQDNGVLILSNYRIIHNYFKISSMHQIKLYQLSQIETYYKEKKKQYKLLLRLSIPYILKILFLFSHNISQYKLTFVDRSDLILFLRYLKHLSNSQKLNIKFFDEKSIQKQFNKNDYLLMEIIDEQVHKAKVAKEQQEQVIRQRDRWTNIRQSNMLKKTKK